MKFKIHPAAVIIIAFFIWNKSFARLLLSAVLHELGHAAAAFLIGRRRLVFTLSPLGWSLYAGELCGGAALLVYAAGPLVSLMLTPVLAPQTLWIFAFNMLPMLPLDGGRIAAELLGKKAAAELGGYALLFALFLSALNEIIPTGVIALLILANRYASSVEYGKIRRAADFLQDLY